MRIRQESTHASSVSLGRRKLRARGIYCREIHSARLRQVLVEGERLGAEDMQPLIEELAVKQVRRLRQFLRARVRNTADVQDIIQEVFPRLLRVPSHETIRIPVAYIFTIARHAAQEHRLKVRPRGRLCRPRRGPVRLSSRFRAGSGARRSHCPAVRGGRGGRPAEMVPKPRATFLLYRRDGLSMEEISERLGISRPMAKKYLVKALADLRQRLKEME